MVTLDMMSGQSQGQKGPAWSSWSPLASTALTRRGSTRGAWNTEVATKETKGPKTSDLDRPPSD